MKLTRRNTLIGLGILAGGAGLIGGSGAFSSVQAGRSFEVSVAGDASALLALEATNDQIAATETGSGGEKTVLYFTLDTPGSGSGGDAPVLNQDAVTEFFDAFSISNNGSQRVDVSMDTGGARGISFVVEAEELASLDSDVDLTAGTVALTPGDTAKVDLAIDTSGQNGYEDPGERNGGEPYQMTITAQAGGG